MRLGNVLKCRKNIAFLTGALNLANLWPHQSAVVKTLAVEPTLDLKASEKLEARQQVPPHFGFQARPASFYQ